MSSPYIKSDSSEEEVSSDDADERLQLRRERLRQQHLKKSKKKPQKKKKTKVYTPPTTSSEEDGNNSEEDELLCQPAPTLDNNPRNPVELQLQEMLASAEIKNNPKLQQLLAIMISDQNFYSLRQLLAVLKGGVKQDVTKSIHSNDPNNLFNMNGKITILELITPLKNAIFNGNLSLVNYLLSCGADPEYPAPTPLPKPTWEWNVETGSDFLAQYCPFEMSLHMFATGQRWIELILLHPWWQQPLATRRGRFRHSLRASNPWWEIVQTLALDPRTNLHASCHEFKIGPLIMTEENDSTMMASMSPLEIVIQQRAKYQRWIHQFRQGYTVNDASSDGTIYGSNSGYIHLLQLMQQQQQEQSCETNNKEMDDEEMDDEETDNEEHDFIVVCAAHIKNLDNAIMWLEEKLFSLDKNNESLSFSSGGSGTVVELRREVSRLKVALHDEQNKTEEIKSYYTLEINRLKVFEQNEIDKRAEIFKNRNRRRRGAFSSDEEDEEDEEDKEEVVDVQRELEKKKKTMKTKTKTKKKKKKKKVRDSLEEQDDVSEEQKKNICWDFTEPAAGDRVMVMCEGWTNFFPGTVTRCLTNFRCVCYSIEFDNGETQDRVPIEQLKRWHDAQQLSLEEIHGSNDVEKKKKFERKMEESHYDDDDDDFNDFDFDGSEKEAERWSRRGSGGRSGGRSGSRRGSRGVMGRELLRSGLGGRNSRK